MERLWNPICVATLNADVDRVSLRAARHVLREGFFSPDGAGLGLFTWPLGRIFDVARDYVETRGGEVHTSIAVRRIRVGRDGVSAVELESGETMEADAIVAAVPPWNLAALVPETPLQSTLEAAAGLRWSPIVDVHLWFDRPVLDDDFVIAVDSELQSVFDVSRLHARDRSRREGRLSEGKSRKRLQPMEGVAHLVISQSAADRWIGRPADAIADELLAALGDLVPRVRAANLSRSLVIKHRRATFVSSPGCGDLRPLARTSIGGLYLAGDWTATGWPSTIEGAIRSGVSAAAWAAAPE